MDPRGLARAPLAICALTCLVAASGVGTLAQDSRGAQSRAVGEARNREVQPDISGRLLVPPGVSADAFQVTVVEAAHPRDEIFADVTVRGGEFRKKADPGRYLIRVRCRGVCWNMSPLL